MPFSPLSQQFAFAGFLFAALSVSSAHATTFTFNDPGAAQAVITTGNGTISLTLTDLVQNPTDVASNLSAFSFTLSSSPTSESISSSSAITRTVAGDGSFTNGSAVSPGWSLSLVGATTSLDDLVGSGHAGPAETIIGAPGAGNNYSNANGSITGNGPHNPFLDQSATWTFTAAGVTTATAVTAATFQFGTTDGSNHVTGTFVPTSTPEPGTLYMLWGAVGLVPFWQRKRIAALVSRHRVASGANLNYLKLAIPNWG
jgi:hypothetical protein